MQMQEFVEERFPEDISFGSSGGPEYSTDIIETVNGHEIRNVNWERPRARYNVAHGIRTDEQLAKLIAFFRVRKGRAVGFRFKDWSDYKGEKEYLGIADGEETIFLLGKYYLSGDVVTRRMIAKPVLSTLKLYLEDKLIDSQDYKCCYKSGSVCFYRAPGVGVLRADFEFDVPVRFDTDHLSMTLEGYGLNSCYDIPLIELK